MLIHSRKPFIVLPLFALLVSCSGLEGNGPSSGSGGIGSPGSGGNGSPGSGDIASPRLVAHEWGTFTSMQSSLGETMDGMAHEDEPLPKFVHGRADLLTRNPCVLTKGGLEFCPKNVTQKLETPVIYFYGDASEVTVKVDFPRGIISQWYPGVASFAPAINALRDGAVVGGGSMTWIGKLDPNLGDADFPAVAATDIWAPSRRVKSLPVRISGRSDEKERFIFYRGLGSFDPALRIHSVSDSELAIRNDSRQPIPNAYLLHVEESGGFVKSLGAIGAAGSKQVLLLSGRLGADSFIAQAKQEVKQGLVASGLTDDESQAMVDTWERSYFKIPGTRVLYIVPREWTDQLLPIKITPQPTELVRTLVGRVEVLTVTEEQQIMGVIKDYSARRSPYTDSTKVMSALGRFAEPKLRRGCQMARGSAGSAALLASCNGLVREAVGR